MIEKLTNCPSCGGILSESGRCQFCGSKVYDFLSITFNDPNCPSAKTYIRIKVNGQIMLAPIVVNTVGISMSCDPYTVPEIDVNLMVVGDMILIDKEASDGKSS